MGYLWIYKVDSKHIIRVLAALGARNLDPWL